MKGQLFFPLTKHDLGGRPQFSLGGPCFGGPTDPKKGETSLIGFKMGIYHVIRGTFGTTYHFLPWEFAA